VAAERCRIREMGTKDGNFLLERTSAVIALLLFVADPAFAGESAVLNNGFRIHADSHEVIGAIIRLRVGDGSIEIPAVVVSRFEADDVTFRPASPPASYLEPQATASVPLNARSPQTVQEGVNAGAEHPGRPTGLHFPFTAMPADSDLLPSNLRSIPVNAPVRPVDPGPGGDSE